MPNGRSIPETECHAKASHIIEQRTPFVLISINPITKIHTETLIYPGDESITKEERINNKIKLDFSILEYTDHYATAHAKLLYLNHKLSGDT